MTGAEYTTSAEANLLDEGIDRYLGMRQWKDVDRIIAGTRHAGATITANQHQDRHAGERMFVP